MQRLFLVLLLVAVAGGWLLAAAPDETVCRVYQGKTVCQPAEAHAVLVRIQASSDALEVMNRLVILLDAKDLNYLALSVPGTYKIHSHSLTAQQLYDKLNGDPDLQWVEPNAQAQLVTHNAPNDPWWASMQWWLDNNAGYQGGDGLGSACIKGIAPGFTEAWT